MIIDISKVKIFVTVPKEQIDEVRTAVLEAGAGHIGNYTHCSSVVDCIGTFKPNDLANPYLGNKNKLEFVEEIKLEVVCNIEQVKDILLIIREVHPYEEPAIDIVPLLDESSFI